jgi:hypothetical protein
LKILKLRKQKLDLFASIVQQFGELHAPVEQDGKYVFQRLTRWSEARLGYDRTILPHKKYFLPPRETLFHYGKEVYHFDLAALCFEEKRCARIDQRNENSLGSRWHAASFGGLPFRDTQPRLRQGSEGLREEPKSATTLRPRTSRGTE